MIVYKTLTMRFLNSILYALLIINLTANAQFSYDPQKVSAIRWTPIPESSGDLKDVKIDLNGTWQFNPSPEKEFFQSANPLNLKTIDVPGEWVMQGHAVKTGE